MSDSLDKILGLEGERHRHCPNCGNILSASVYDGRGIWMCKNMVCQYSSYREMSDSLDKILGLEASPGAYPCYWFDGRQCRFVEVEFSLGSWCHRANMLREGKPCPHGIKGSKALQAYIDSGRKWGKKI